MTVLAAAQRESGARTPSREIATGNLVSFGGFNDLAFIALWVPAGSLLCGVTRDGLVVFTWRMVSKPAHPVLARLRGFG